MKKFIMALAIVLLVIGALPFVGNKLAQNMIEQRVTLLESYGVKAIVSTTDSSYLKTQKHFEFLIKDEEKFMLYLEQFSSKQLPPYTQALLKGVVVGVDADYSNLPLSDGVTVDIYPLSLSTNIMQEIKQKDAKFSAYLQKFLESKGVLYHINYNVVLGSFDGYIKDIQEQYIFDGKTEMKLTLLDATYKGKGPIIAPTSLISKLQKIELQLSQGSEVLLFELDDFSSDASFETQSNYSSSAELKNFRLKLENLGKDIVVEAANLTMSLASDTEGKYAQILAHNTIESFRLLSENLDLNTSALNYDVALNDLDKDTLQELMQLPKGEALEHILVKLLSKGLTLDVKEFSLGNIGFNSSQNLRGFTLGSKFILKPDANFAQKFYGNSMQLLSSLDATINFKLSKKIFALISEVTPMAFIAKAYAKESADSLLFDIRLLNGELKVNGKALK